MPVKIDREVADRLLDMGLTVWSAKHPKVASGISPKTGKTVFKEDKNWCIVELAGPGLEDNPIGSGKTFRAAARNALKHKCVVDRVPGLYGAMMRLDAALLGLNTEMHFHRLWVEDGAPGSKDDYVTF
jgi:hypothetical protein